MNAAARFEAMIADVLEAQGDRLSPIGLGLMAAAYVGLSRDTRSFARALDLAHALVIRECVALGEEGGLIQIEDRADRSQRLFFSLTPRGQALIAGAAAA